MSSYSSGEFETNSSPSSKTRKSGGLREKLITSGLEILAEEGLGKLTLRRVAARAGVSHAAPAHHFKGLPELLGCICRVGYERLAESMLAKRDAVGSDPRARLIAICDGYIAFAQDNPGLVQLMFNSLPEAVSHAEMADVADQAYQVLQETCAPFRPVGNAPDSTETMVWSLVHGFAFLGLGNGFEQPRRLTRSPNFADVLPDLMLRTP